VEVVSGGEFEFNAKTSYDLNVCASDLDCDDLDDCTEDACLENTCIYSQMKCEDCGKVKVVVYIYTDWIPEEISWIVSMGSTGTGDVVMSGNSYSDIEYLYVESKCSDLGTYTFSIFDSGGNGICCEMGNGYYKMTVGNDNVQLLQGGDFDLLEEITFNIDTTPSDKPSSIPSIMPSMVPSNMPSMSFLPSLTQLPSSSLYPTNQPSNSPSKSSIPSISRLPSASVHPSNYPTISVYPSSHPSSLPSQLPSDSIIPSANPSMTEYSSCLAVKVKTDDYPGEITWKVVDSGGDIILEGGPYDDAWTSYSNMDCINRGLYSFIIYDRLGSGSLFDGYYMLSLDNTVIKSASSFERTETTAFTISDTFEPTLSINPSSNPSEQNLPTGIPSLSMSPSDKPSVSPTIVASQSPSLSIIPTFIPSNMPSEEPTLHPSTSLSPSTTPTNQPTKTPSLNPSVSHLPSVSQKPSFSIPIPTLFPSQSPSNKPSYEPSLKPSVGPTNVHSNSPSNMPSNIPSTSPSDIPSDVPSSSSSPSSRFAIYSCPDLPTRQPTSRPSLSSYPSIVPSDVPSLSHVPSLNPSTSPSMSMIPSSGPSLTPSSIPSFSTSPSASMIPSLSLAPSLPPTNAPTNAPTDAPTNAPTNAPTSNPTLPVTSSPSFISQTTEIPSFNPTNPTSSPSKSNQQSFNPSSSNPAPSNNLPPTNAPTFQPQPTAPSTKPPTLLTTQAPTQAPTLATVITSYEQSFAGSDDLTLMNSTQIAIYESNMVNTAENLPLSSQIASHTANMASHTTSIINMNIECKVTNQQIESVPSTSPTNPSIVWPRKLSITYDLKVVSDLKWQIEVYNEQYIDNMSEKNDQIKQSMVDMQVQVEDIYVTIEMPSSAPSVRPSASIINSPTTPSPAALPNKSPKPSNESSKTTKPASSKVDKNSKQKKEEEEEEKEYENK